MIPDERSYSGSREHELSPDGCKIIPTEMENAYEKEFGSKLVLSKGIENAGYEWIDRIIKNKI
jgi:hypothetical protein